MDILKSCFLVFSTVVGMELFSWFMHKYLFHGPLWFIHRTHHKPQGKSVLEWNDLFSLGFGGLSVYLIYDGHSTLSYTFWIGVGISVYGIIYFILHDWFTHGRFRSYKPENRYVKAIIRAHKIHHKSIHKHPSTEFGLLLVSKKYFRKVRSLNL